MSELLDLAIAAHGGWNRWQKSSKLTVKGTIGGGVWAAKGQAPVTEPVRIEVDLHRQHVEYWPFKAAGQHSVYEPDRTSVVTDDGKALQTRENPRASFIGHVRETPWDDLHLTYFRGYAMWTYLTTPFLFGTPGFVCEEIEPWLEDGDEWRRLKVTFPATVASHSKEQTFYFDKAGILRRHDYAADVLGGTGSANYASDPMDFGGLIIPTKRRVYARDPENRPIKERVFVTIDIEDVKVS